MFTFEKRKVFNVFVIVFIVDCSKKKYLIELKFKENPINSQESLILKDIYM